MPQRKELRLITYLSPSIPRQLFELVARHPARTLDIPISLREETRTSDPQRDHPHPLAFAHSGPHRTPIQCFARGRGGGVGLQTYGQVSRCRGVGGVMELLRAGVCWGPAPLLPGVVRGGRAPGLRRAAVAALLELPRDPT